MRLSLALYRAIWGTALGLRVPQLVLRGRPAELAERLGRGPAGSGSPLWIHAASVGEMRAVEALVRALRKEGPPPIALSAMTRTGRASGRAVDPEIGPVHPPLDAPGPVRTFLDRLRPRGFVVVETELWPQLLLELSRRSVPWAVVSGRISERALRRLRPVRGLFRHVLGGAGAVGARTREDAERFLCLGAPRSRVHLTGDLKEDRCVGPRTDPPADVPRWIAACTRPGEEEAALEALHLLAAELPAGELLLAPRHPERFEEVASLASRAGFPVRRWSQRDRRAAEPGWSILLVDEMGVLEEAYRRSACAFVGGSLRPFGGHSPWEAAAAGRPILLGPHTDHCRDAAGRLEAAGAVVRVATVSELAGAVGRLLRRPDEAPRRGCAAHASARGRGGAGEATVRLLGEAGVLG